jgi:hypothetical protein
MTGMLREQLSVYAAGPFLLNICEGGDATKAGSGNHVTEDLIARRPCKPRLAEIIGIGQQQNM